VSNLQRDPKDSLFFSSPFLVPQYLVSFVIILPSDLLSRSHTTLFPYLTFIYPKNPLSFFQSVSFPSLSLSQVSFPFPSSRLLCVVSSFHSNAKETSHCPSKMWTFAKECGSRTRNRNIEFTFFPSFLSLLSFKLSQKRRRQVCLPIDNLVQRLKQRSRRCLLLRSQIKKTTTNHPSKQLPPRRLELVDLTRLIKK